MLTSKNKWVYYCRMQIYDEISVRNSSFKFIPRATLVRRIKTIDEKSLHAFQIYWALK